MSPYKPHYACFKCRKTFKRKLKRDLGSEFRNDQAETPAKCPECSELMADMGLDFEAPKKKDIKAWKHIEQLYSVGITFHSCGCIGPGYIPANKVALISHLEETMEIYLMHQHFWSQRKAAPETQSEIAKDKHENWVYLVNSPPEARTGTKKQPRHNVLIAQQYWNEKVLSIESKIKRVTSSSEY